MECGEGRMYEACAAECEITCDNYKDINATCSLDKIVEGCFCKPGLVSVLGDCVPESNCTNCIDEDGNIYNYSESWRSPEDSCIINTCMEDQVIMGSRDVCNDDIIDLGSGEWEESGELSGSGDENCTGCFIQQEIIRDPCCPPKYECVCNYERAHGSDECRAVTIPVCPKPGHVAERTNPEGCIPQYTCVCDVDENPCPGPPICTDAQSLKKQDTFCCPTYECECDDCKADDVTCSECQDTVIREDECNCPHTECRDKGVCRRNGINYQPGDTYQGDPCLTCTCGSTDKDSDGCYLDDCVPKHCVSDCSPCHAIEKKEGECCGRCVKTGCEYPDYPLKEEKCLNISEEWKDEEHCINYICVPDGLFPIQYPCEPVILPDCGKCYNTVIRTENCCPVAVCVKDDVCCSLDGHTSTEVGQVIPQADTCQTCVCSATENTTSGFHVVQCTPKSCPAFNATACKDIGGSIVPTDDGCCTECNDKCVDREGNTHPIGESWRPDQCLLCSCTKGNKVACSTIACNGTAPPVPSCGPCFKLTRKPESDPCCPEFECVCDYDLSKGDSDCSPVIMPDCEPGYSPFRTNPTDCIPSYECTCAPYKNPCPIAPTCSPLEHLVSSNTSCCTDHKCVCNTCDGDIQSCSSCEEAVTTIDECKCEHVTCKPKNVCYDNGLVYQVGDKWHQGVCKTCECSADQVNSNTSCHIHVCKTEHCVEHCPPCHTYVPSTVDCCGSCVQTQCNMTGLIGDHCKQVGEEWKDETSCTAHECTIDTDDGTPKPTPIDYKCGVPDLPNCGSCYQPVAVTDGCCSKYECAPRAVCCVDEVPMEIGDNWIPGVCETCNCTDTFGDDNFYVTSCQSRGCDEVDEDDCVSGGGRVVGTDDGCCQKCEVPWCPSTVAPTPAEPTTTVSCEWTDWMNSDHPKSPQHDDNDTYVHLREDGFTFCDSPVEIECRLVKDPSKTFDPDTSPYTCDVTTGLLCLGEDQPPPSPPICHDYELRVKCCNVITGRSFDGVLPEAEMKEEVRKDEETKELEELLRSYDTADLVNGLNKQRKTEKNVKKTSGKLNKKNADKEIENQVKRLLHGY